VRQDHSSKRPPRRDRYADVCRAARVVSARASEAGLTLREERVLRVVIAETALWSRFGAETSLARLAAATGLAPNHVGEALHALARHGLIGYQPGGTGWARKQRAKVSLPEVFAIDPAAGIEDPPIDPAAGIEDPPIDPAAGIEDPPIDPAAGIDSTRYEDVNTKYEETTCAAAKAATQEAVLSPSLSVSPNPNPADDQPRSLSLSASEEGRQFLDSQPESPTPTAHPNPTGTHDQTKSPNCTPTPPTPPPPAPRPPGHPLLDAPDPLWDALIGGCGIVGPFTKSARGAYNEAVAQLRQIGASPEEVAPRIARYRGAYPRATATPSAVVRHWAELAAPIAPPNPRDARLKTGPQAGPQKVLSVAEFRAMREAREAS
jgi:hypothetical protein